MRNISFMLTTEQFLNRTKCVTRRLGWKTIKAGDHLMGCKKCMGLKPGQKTERLGEIVVVDARFERLDAMLGDDNEAVLEGFPEMTSEEFVAMFCKNMVCKPADVVTRIQYDYVDSEAHLDH